jgi:hypothetical protein
MSLLAFTWTWKLFLNISTILILVDLNVGICWNRFVCAIEHFTPTRNFTQQQLTMWNKIRLCHGCLDLWSWRVFYIVCLVDISHFCNTWTTPWSPINLTTWCLIIPHFHSNDLASLLTNPTKWLWL